MTPVVVVAEPVRANLVYLDKQIGAREAALESAGWISVGLLFTLVVWWWFGIAATGEYVAGYLTEKSLSINNVFVWGPHPQLLQGPDQSRVTVVPRPEVRPVGTRPGSQP